MNLDEPVPEWAAGRARLAWTLTLRYFPTNADVRLHQQIVDLLSWVRAYARSYAQGPLRHAVVIAYLDPAPCRGRTPWHGSHARVRLQLEDGRLYALQLHGNTQSALDRLDQLAVWLARHARAASSVEASSVSLSAVANAGYDSASACQVQVIGAAPVAPTSRLRSPMLYRMTLAGFNKIRNGYGLRPLSRLPALLDDHVSALVTQVDSVARCFVQQIDRRVLALCADAKATRYRLAGDVRTYNFFIDPDRSVLRNRMQAVRALPWLLPVFLDTDAVGAEPVGVAHASALRESPPALTDWGLATIRAAIDEGRPLFDAVATALGVPRETVRWTRGRWLPNVSHRAQHRIDLLLALLSWLPPEKRPDTDADWDHVQELVPPLLSILSFGQDGPAFADGLRTNAGYGKVMGRWLRELLQPDLAAGAVKLIAMRRQHQDPDQIRNYVDTLLNGMHRFCIEPAGDVGHAHRAHVDALLSWLARKPLHFVAHCAVQWHARLDAQLQHDNRHRADIERHGVAWPAVLTTPLHVGALTVVELTDTPSLVAEGIAMHHCVGGYTASCVYGDRMVVSIRDGLGHRRSTAELSIDRVSLQVVTRQHKGKQNTAPPPDAEQTLERLLGTLNGAAFRHRVAARAAFQRNAQQRAQLMPCVRNAGLDGYQQLAEETAWQTAFGSVPSARSVDFRARYLTVPC